jgi:hypothetical protein
MSAKILHKWQRVTKRLLAGPVHRMEAEKAPVFDHCLPSTISELKKDFGLVIHARMIRLPGYARLGAHVAEYRLDEQSMELARQLVQEEDREDAA